MKNIGKPCTGKPYARFAEGGLVSATMVWPFSHRLPKAAATDKPSLRCAAACPLLYPYFSYFFATPYFFGKMALKQWYFLPAGGLDPHHEKRWDFPLLVRASEIQ
jgi:hypothetical protein